MFGIPRSVQKFFQEGWREFKKNAYLRFRRGMSPLTSYLDPTIISCASCVAGQISTQAPTVTKKEEITKNDESWLHRY